MGFTLYASHFGADLASDFDVQPETLSRYEPKRWREGLQPRLEFFFDCSSPWTYLAFVRLLKLANRVSVDLTWKPILVGGVFNKVNADVYKQRETPNPVKTRYYQKDLADWATLVDIKILKPRVFPVKSVTAMRGCFYAIEQNLIVPYAQNLFEAYWRDDRDISQDDEVARCAALAGLDGEALLSFAKSDAARSQLVGNTQEIMDRGGFGSPTFFINTSDMYFGNDRLELIEAALVRLNGEM